MPDENFSFENPNKNIEPIKYKSCILELYKTFLILRNMAYGEEEIESQSSESHTLYKIFDDTAYNISQIPLFFQPTEITNLKLEDWCIRLNRILPFTSNIFDTKILRDEEDLPSIIKIQKEISEFLSVKQSKRFARIETTSLYLSMTPEFKSIKLIYDNAIESKKIENEINRVNEELKKTLDKSKQMEGLLEEFKINNSNFKIYTEQNYNDHTKEIYAEIYNTEYALADKYRKYAILVFLIIAIFALINFLLPTIEGIINYFKINKFQTSPISILFFVRTIFLLLLTAPGWYFARESAKHRQVAYKAKIVSAELAALPFYIADLELKDRREMRIKMADKFFGQELYNDKKSDNSNVSEQTKATTEAIKTINALLSKPIKPSDVL
ncbi:hypothetical protein KTI78_10050 [Acinetobacter sp. WU_MDCI_Abxe161]|uniref:hypothetical protein n=1 Tax=Acinetobacter sp. WU_MDCI_Abxe161 TaxID=2850074 RepID=UPI0021CDE4F4|nr:hypothetical protein [Acinetobacter sp. WU_MDCI_Abxe161]MCU4503510.1 hypothetical protein [Acinetobacter sp. WU_MDCI_Abxe161]